MTNNDFLDWQQRFTIEKHRRRKAAGTAQRALEQNASANLATQEDLAAWLQSQGEMLERGHMHLVHLREAHADIVKALERLG